MHILTGPSFVLFQTSRHHQNYSSFMGEVASPSNNIIYSIQAQKQQDPQRISLKPEALAQARGVPSLRRDHDRGSGRFVAYSLRGVLLRLSEPTPRPKVRSPRLGCPAATHLELPRVLAQVSVSRLSEMVLRSNQDPPPERELKRKLAFVPLQVSPRRDRVAWARITSLAHRSSYNSHIFHT